MPILIDDLQLITGIDIPVPELGITLRQPKIKDIAILGETDYFLALSIFRMSTKNLKVVSPEVTNWMIFNEALNQQIEGVNVRVLLSNFLQLFVVERINIGPRSLIVQTKEGIANIEPEQFTDFQDIVGQVGGSSLMKTPEKEFNPGSARAAEIASKMQKTRAKLAAMQPQSKSQGFLTKYVKAVATVTANSLEQVSSMTILQLNDLMQMYLAWESYDLEVRSRLAGAKGDNKLEHWMTRSNEKESTIATI